MPGRDGSGPMGLGPMSGRRMGPCSFQTVQSYGRRGNKQGVSNGPGCGCRRGNGNRNGIRNGNGNTDRNSNSNIVG